MNNNGLISRQTAIDKLSEYAESKFQSGEIELANGILKAKCFLESPCNIPTAYDVDKVLEELESEREYAHADFEEYAELHGIDTEDDWFYAGMRRAIEIVKAGD